MRILRDLRHWLTPLACLLMMALGAPGALADVPRLEVVFVVDTTYSMGEWLPQIQKGLDRFVTGLEAGPERENARQSLRMGLLFFRDRKERKDCDIGYLTEWRVELTSKVGYECVRRTLSGLERARETTCKNNEEAEAVFDALNRAILDPAWSKDARHTVILVTDAPPHAAGSAKNPLNYSEQTIAKSADEKRVHILSLVVQRDPMFEFTDYKALANDQANGMTGSFQSVAERSGDLANGDTKLLNTEWSTFEQLTGMKTK